MIRTVGLLAAAVPTLGTALSLIRHPHWIFRSWDFPRVQMAVTAAAGALLLDRRKPRHRVVQAAAAAAIAWQIYKIHPYTPLVRKQVKDAGPHDDGGSLSLLMCNVLQDNREYGRVVATVRERRPDVLLIVENDEPWTEVLERELSDLYPHRITQPLDNYYGMLLFSKLEMKARVQYLVQDDIPSIHARIRMRNGVEVEVHALHPRPPEPLRDQRSTPRDAELVMVGRAVAKKKDVPVVVAGDLNDVAWSETSQLFVRLSGLLDPRIGRGFYNSYNAKNPLARFPLDHVFHSKDFKLIRLERLWPVGSDHFPIYAELLYEPEAAAVHEESEKKPGDEKQADERLAQQQEDAGEGKDRPARE